MDILEPIFSKNPLELVLNFTILKYKLRKDNGYVANFPFLSNQITKIYLLNSLFPKTKLFQDNHKLTKQRYIVQINKVKNFQIKRNSLITRSKLDLEMFGTSKVWNVLFLEFGCELTKE